jgi:hypothetical protein
VQIFGKVLGDENTPRGQAGCGPWRRNTFFIFGKVFQFFAKTLHRSQHRQPWGENQKRPGLKRSKSEKRGFGVFSKNERLISVTKNRLPTEKKKTARGQGN